MCRQNPTWGAPRIQSELALLGCSVAEATVANYTLPKPRRPSQLEDVLEEPSGCDRRRRLLLHCPHVNRSRTIPKETICGYLSGCSPKESSGSEPQPRLYSCIIISGSQSMDDQRSYPEQLCKAVVLVLTVAISAIFLDMIRGFLIVLFLAAVFSSLIYPYHQFVVRKFGGRGTVAAIFSLTVVTLTVVLPLMGLLGVVAAQGYQLTEELLPRIKQQLSEGDNGHFQLPEWLPLRDRIQVSNDQIVAKLGEFAGKASQFLLGSLSAATQGTATFFLHLFIMLYAMYFFLKEGPSIQTAVFQTLPLPADVKRRLLEKATSITRATIKGTIVIGAIQGFLGGVAFAFSGVHSAAFWGAVMAVASVIPGIGTALVWVPAVLYLFATGSTAMAIALTAWCALVIGSIDNVLRPRLVGGDTQMPDLLILISTFGGLSVFGAVGLIVGPTIAGLFVTIWDVFGQTFGIDEPVENIEIN
jgi:predicted PurR-regulated permease PerM